MINVEIGETCIGLTLKDSASKTKIEKVLTLAVARELARDLIDACNKLDYKMRCAKGSVIDDWIPACGGTEEPFLSRSGKRLLYCFNPVTKKHAYLNLETDMILSDEEARQALETF